jgi:hypothetical protein
LIIVFKFKPVTINSYSIIEDIGGSALSSNRRIKSDRRRIVQLNVKGKFKFDFINIYINFTIYLIVKCSINLTIKSNISKLFLFAVLRLFLEHLIKILSLLLNLFFT